MKLGYILELVLATAVGLALAIGWMEEDQASPTETTRFYSHFCFYLLSGVILVESIGLWIERARRRGPRPWGIGRRMWSTLGVVCLCLWVWSVAKAELYQRLNEKVKPSVWRMVLENSPLGTAPDALSWMPLALLITTFLAGLPRDPKPDAREWSGRLIGTLILLLYLSEEIYLLYYYEVF